MPVHVHALESKQRHTQTESERLGALRAEASKIIGALQRGETTEEEAVRALNRLANEQTGILGRISQFVR